jgi:hypothetical protein
VEDTIHGDKNIAPMKEDQRVVVLSPINESYQGPQYDHNAVSAGEVPSDPLGYFSRGTEEVPDEAFHAWPDEGRPTVANYELTRYAGNGKTSVPKGRSKQLKEVHFKDEVG